jgi:ribonuclease BN (tRNA processing enzyme)
MSFYHQKCVRSIWRLALTHFHPDHISDLIPLLQAGAWSRRDLRTSDLHIYGPQVSKD